MSALADALAAAHPAWLVLAVGLHLCAQVCRGLAWQGVLGPVCPGTSRRTVCSWHVTGAGLSGLLSARGADAVRLGLARRARPETSVPTLAGSLALETSSETLFGVLTAGAALALGIGALTAPSVPVLAGGLVLVAAATLAAARHPRSRRVLREAAAGMRAARDPRRYAVTVLPFQLIGRAARLASLACFLLAFGLPASPAVVLAVCAAQGSGRLIPVPGLGTAAAAAGLLLAIPAAAGRPVAESAVGALALAQPALLSLVGLSLSAALLVGPAGARSPQALLVAVRGLRPAPAPA